MNIRDIIEYYNISSVWHFTDRSNLESIEEHGLLSLEKLTQENIEVPCYGANELSHKLDRERGLDRYVHLSLIKEHPMQFVKKQNGEIPNPIWIEIDVSVLFEDKTIFSDTVANASGSKIYEIDDLDNFVDLEVLWSRTNWSDPVIQQRRKIAKKSEIMIANKIDTNLIVGVYHG